MENEFKDLIRQLYEPLFDNFVDTIYRLMVQQNIDKGSNDMFKELLTKQAENIKNNIGSLNVNDILKQMEEKNGK